MAQEAARDVDRLGWYVPDFAKLQTGGFRGRYSAGLGYAAFDDVLNVGLLYGYSPDEVGSSGLSTLSLEIAARPLEIPVGQLRILPIEVGVGALYAIGPKFELRYPDRYSSGYYKPTALHAMLHLGVGLDWVPRGIGIERVGLYYQVSSIHPFLYDLLANPGVVSIHQSFASSVGVRAAF